MSVLLHIADTHFGTERAPVVAAVRTLIQRETPSLVVLSGDVTQRASAVQFRAARAFIDSLAPVPALIVPGNHDIALFDLLSRCLRPYARYLRALGTELEPESAAPGWLVIGVSTTRRYRHVEGTLSRAQIKRVAARLRQTGPQQLRVVTLHQPIAVITQEDEQHLVRRHTEAAIYWAEAGADQVLGGHIHLPYVCAAHEQLPGLSRRLWAIQAGTAISHRIRGGMGNSINIIRRPENFCGATPLCCRSLGLRRAKPGLYAPTQRDTLSHGRRSGVRAAPRYCAMTASMMDLPLHYGPRAVRQPPVTSETARTRTACSPHCHVADRYFSGGDVRVTAALFAALLLGAAPLQASAAYRVALTAPDALQELLAAHLDLMRYQDREDLNADQFDFMVDTVANQVQKLTSTEGYFSPSTKVRVEQEDDGAVVHVEVEAGPQTRIANLNLGVKGAAPVESPRQVGRLRQNWGLTVGEPFRQADWAEAKSEGLQRLQRRRYPAARIESSTARVYRDLQQADLEITYHSGPLFTFGKPEVTGLQRYPERIIRNLNPIEQGEEYSVERLQEFQRQIQRMPYFSNVVIDIDKNPANAEHAPMRVQVTEFPAQRVWAGAGYATDTGTRVEGRYAHNNVFNRAWVFDTQLRLEQRRQLWSLNLARPPSPGAFINSLNASTERTTLEGVDLRTRRLGARRARQSDLQDFATTIAFYRDSLEQLNGATLPPDTVVKPGVQQALVAGIALTRREVNNPIFPRSGYVVTLEAGGAVKGLLTDQTFGRVYSQIRRFVPAGRRDLVILRGELGAILTKGGTAAIPATLLFRAGGTESVRGYTYQGIGNVVNGTVYPTRFLVTGGAEYQHWFREQYGAAVFYDVGTATDNWPDRQFFQGIGIGARYRSPVGRISLDLAYGVKDKRFRPHFSLGVVF